MFRQPLTNHMLKTAHDEFAPNHESHEMSSALFTLFKVVGSLGGLLITAAFIAEMVLL